MISEILNVFGFDCENESLGFKCVVLGDKGIYFEGVNKLKKITPSEIVIRTKKNDFSVKGEKLKIKVMSKFDIVVEGKIINIEFFNAR